MTTTTTLWQVRGHPLRQEDIMIVIMMLCLQLSMLPESVIVETTEYKCLQSQFSVLYNESMQIKTQLDENRTMLVSSKNTHLRQIEQMEVTWQSFS